MKELDFSHMHEGLKTLVLAAMDLDWTAVDIGKGGIVLHSPISAKKITVPRVRQIREGNRKAIANQIATHSDETKMRAWAQARRMVDDADLPVELRADLMMATAPHETKGNLLGEAVPSNAPPPPVVETARRPWLARGQVRNGTREMYESPVVVEVEFSDGSRTYECVVTGCDYTNAEPHNVVSHYNRSQGQTHRAHKAARDREAEQLPVTTDPSQVEPVERSYTPSDRLVRLLAHALQEVMDGQDYYTADDLAREALVWAHERPDLPDPEPREPREMTADEVLARIRTLVSPDVVTLRDEVAALRAELQAATERAEVEAAARLAADQAAAAARAETERVRADVDTLADILNGIREGRDTEG